MTLSSGLFVVVDGDGEEMTNACIVLGRGGGDDGSEVDVVVMMALLEREVHFFIFLLTVA